MASLVQFRGWRRATDGRRPAFISVSRRNDEKEIARHSGGWRADNADGRFTGVRPDAGRSEDRHGHGVGPDHRVTRVFHEPGVRARRVRLLPGEEHRQHPVEELHRLRDFVPGLLRLRLGAHVRQRHRLHRPRGPVRDRRSGQQPRDRRRVCRAPTRRLRGRAFR